MSVRPYLEPDVIRETAPDVAIDIVGRTRDLGGGITVRRLLPSAARRMIGPFIFVDHLGPVQLDAGNGLDIRPHPHINLATVTYLFDGEILHRDSLGTEQAIRPGAVNWMTAGRGIVHSERSPADTRKAGVRAHGMQLWVALPKKYEEIAPEFAHHPADAIPEIDLPGVRARIIAGSAYGVCAPTRVLSPLFYVEALVERGARLSIPDGQRERAAYIVDGTVACDEEPYRKGSMLVFREGPGVTISALENSRVMLLGGEPLDGERYIWWNFVSSSLERIEGAKVQWRDRRFPLVPGDEDERIPLPE